MKENVEKSIISRWLSEEISSVMIATRLPSGENAAAEHIRCLKYGKSGKNNLQSSMGSFVFDLVWQQRMCSSVVCFFSLRFHPSLALPLPIFFLYHNSSQSPLVFGSKVGAHTPLLKGKKTTTTPPSL